MLPFTGINICFGSGSSIIKDKLNINLIYYGSNAERSREIEDAWKLGSWMGCDELVLVLRIVALFFFSFSETYFVQYFIILMLTCIIYLLVISGALWSRGPHLDPFRDLATLAPFLYSFVEG